MSEWQPVETAPKDMRAILVFCPGMRIGSLQEEPDMMHIVFWKRDGFRLQDDDHFIIEPAFWMPLPEPPTIQKSSEPADDICAACGSPRSEHMPGGTRYGPTTLCGVFIPQTSREGSKP